MNFCVMLVFMGSFLVGTSWAEGRDLLINGYEIRIDAQADNTVVILKEGKQVFSKKKPHDHWTNSTAVRVPEAHVVSGEFHPLNELATVPVGSDLTGDGVPDLLFMLATSDHRGIEVTLVSLGEEVKVLESFRTLDTYKISAGLLEKKGPEKEMTYEDIFKRYGNVVLCRKTAEGCVLAKDIMIWWKGDEDKDFLTWWHQR